MRQPDRLGHARLVRTHPRVERQVGVGRSHGTLHGAEVAHRTVAAVFQQGDLSRDRDQRTAGQLHRQVGMQRGGAGTSGRLLAGEQLAPDAAAAVVGTDAAHDPHHGRALDRRGRQVLLAPGHEFIPVQHGDGVRLYFGVGVDQLFGEVLGFVVLAVPVRVGDDADQVGPLLRLDVAERHPAVRHATRKPPLSSGFGSVLPARHRPCHATRGPNAGAIPRS
jgi:hypothetical protein